MTFRVAGLTNPTIVLPKGARVTVKFINADTDEAHGWLVTSEQPPFTFGQSRDPAIAGAYADIIGHPTPTGDGVRPSPSRPRPQGHTSTCAPCQGMRRWACTGS